MYRLVMHKKMRMYGFISCMLVMWCSITLAAPTPTPYGKDCLYLQYVNTSSACKGGLTSRNISTCVLTKVGDGQGPGQCPGDHADEGGSFSGMLGKDRLIYRFSMVVPHEDWGTGDYSAMSKVWMSDGTNMSFKVRFSRMSATCGETYQVLGTAGPFSNAHLGRLTEAKIQNVTSKRASKTDRLVIDYIASGDGWYTFGVSWGHAEHVFIPGLACPTITPHPVATPTPAPTLTPSVGGIASGICNSLRNLVESWCAQ